MATLSDVHMRISVHGGGWRTAAEALILTALGHLLHLQSDRMSQVIGATCNLMVILLGLELFLRYYQEWRYPEPKVD